jgi:hypothetical protein
MRVLQAYVWQWPDVGCWGLLGIMHRVGVSVLGTVHAYDNARDWNIH